MQIQLYHFSKRNKSTKQPSTADLTLSNVQLKDSTSVIRPIFEIQTVTDPELYNYVYVPSWQRYYFINDWIYMKGRWFCHCIEDFLGSFKAGIITTSCNIMYASGSTKNIVDARIPTMANVLYGEEISALGDMTIVEGTGPIILGITGKGSFGPYLLQYSNDIYEMLDGVDDWWTTEASSLWDAFKQLIFGGTAGECLRSALSLPILVDPAKICPVPASALESLHLGNYPCKNANNNDIKGYKIINPVIKFTEDIDIPWQSADWKKVASYTNIRLYLPLIGDINLPSTELINDSALDITYAVNVTSGDISAQVKGHTSGRIVANTSGNCAMPAPYGSTGVNTSKMTASFAGGLGATALGVASIVATGGASLPAVMAIGGGLAGATAGTVDALGGTGQGSAGLGGGASHALDKVIHCYVTQKVLTDTQTNFNPIMGKPYMGVSTPGAFSGYVQTDGFQFENAFASYEEKDTINGLMNTGVYIE